MSEERYQELRAEKAPWPETPEELLAYIEKVTTGPHDYNSAAHAMSLSAVAAFNYTGRRVGASGFQASCADLDILRQTRDLEAGLVLNFKDALYPQYDLIGKLTRALDEARPWLREQATKLLREQGDEPMNEDVRRHWQSLATIDA